MDSDARTYRVTLASISFAEIEVTAKSVREAYTLAERAAKAARPTFTTCPLATSAHTARLVDPSDPAKGIEWIEAKP
jgi:hypothetical protein